MGIFEKIKKTLSYKGYILITYGVKIGIFEIDELFRYKQKTGIDKVIIIAKEKPFPVVMNKAKEVGIEIILSSDAKNTIASIKMKYKGKDIIVRCAGDIAERGIMEDPC